MNKPEVGNKLLWILAALVMTAIVALYFYGWFNALTCPLSIGYEGHNLYNATALAEGKNIYDPNTLNSPPWSLAIYPPVYYVLVAPFQLAFGWNHWSGRLVSIVSLLITAWASFRLFRLSGASKLVSTVALSTFLSYFCVWSWSFFGRVDLLSIAFSVLAIERFMTIYPDKAARDSEKKKSNQTTLAKIIDFARDYRMAIIFSVLAIFTKQPSVVVPAAISLFLLIRGKKFEAITFGALSFLACLTILLVLNLLTNGGFLLHMRFLSKVPVEIHFLWEHIMWLGVDLLKVIILPVLALKWYFARRTEKQDTILFPFLLALITGVLTLYTLSNEYAHVNHTFHFIFALAWLSAELAKPWPVGSGFLMLSASIASVVVIALYGPSLFYFRTAMNDTIKKLKELNIEDQVILIEDPTIALAAGAKPLFVDLACFMQVWKGHGGSMDKVIEGLKQRKYPYVIVNSHDAERKIPYLYWTKEFIDAVFDNCDKRDTLICYRKRLYYLFVPKKKADSP